MDRFVIIGLGNFGFHAAKSLFEMGKEVIAIDSDRERVHAIGEFSTEAIVLDATDKDRLEVLGLDELDCAIVSTGENMKNSILITLHLKELGMKKIIAKANDEDHAKILTLVGATDIIHPEKDMATKVAQELAYPNMLDYIPLSSDFSIIELEAPKHFVGKSLIDLNLRSTYHVYIIAIKDTASGTFTILPPPDGEIKEGQLLFVLGAMEDLKKVRDVK